MKLVVSNGTVRALHSEDAQRLLETLYGEVWARRASTVEPVSLDGVLFWIADLAPVGGPRMTFGSRADALQFEREWIESNGVPIPQLSL